MKKIMFSDRYGLTEAVLQGRKTMTRRVIRNLSDFDPRQDWIHWSDNGKANVAIIHNETYKYSIYPQYQPGEEVAVAQSYLSIHEEMMNGDYGDGIYDTFRWAEVYNKKGWNNKMFVLAFLMPHQIRITDIKVERLQDISDEDCIKEGIQKMYVGNEVWYEAFKTKIGIKAAQTPKEALAALFDAVSGKGTWERNPWVFAYSFELIK